MSQSGQQDFENVVWIFKNKFTTNLLSNISIGNGGDMGGSILHEKEEEDLSQ